MAWCIQVAKRAFIDDQRRGARFTRLAPALAGAGGTASLADDMDPDDLAAGLDDRLALLFVACDDALARGAQLVLALRIVCGLSIPEVAEHLGIKETAAAARLTRAKVTLATARGEFTVPDAAERRRRLPTVLDCVAGMFTVAHREGFAPLDPLDDLGAHALSIADALATELPDEPEVRGLRALILLGLARRPGRLDHEGVALTLDEVDRSRWDRRLVDAGLGESARAMRLLAGAPPQRYVLEAAISGLHTVAPSTSATDWGQVLALYRELSLTWPSPAVEVASLCARARAQPQDTTEVEARADQDRRRGAVVRPSRRGVRPGRPAVAHRAAGPGGPDVRVAGRAGALRAGAAVLPAPRRAALRAGGEPRQVATLRGSGFPRRGHWGHGALEKPTGRGRARGRPRVVGRGLLRRGGAECRP